MIGPVLCCGTNLESAAVEREREKARRGRAPVDSDMSGEEGVGLRGETLPPG